MTVVIFAQDGDAPVDKIVWELRQRDVPVFRADLSWFPQRLVLDAERRDGRWSGKLHSPCRTVDLHEIRSIWYRDPSAFRFPAGMSDVERTYAHREARLGLGGVLAALPVLWVNHPNRAADALYKPLQLTIADECGLDAPPTLFTNATNAVLRFARSAPHGVVNKTLGPNSVTEDDTLKVVYTHRLNGSDLSDLRGLDVTAHQIQNWIDKDYEARVVAVGNQVFGIAIYAHSEASQIDWRADFDSLSYDLVDVPLHVHKGVLRYMETLGLAYAAFDFCISHDGHWYFLESNSSGQYAWLEAATNANISGALVDLLVTGLRT